MAEKVDSDWSNIDVGMVCEHVLCSFKLFATSLMLESSDTTWVKLIEPSVIVEVPSRPVRSS